ncbi:MAG: cytochrome c oxidase subunit I [Thermoleophilia bacterium]
MATTVAHDPLAPHGEATPPGARRGPLRRAGWLRAAWCTALAFGLATALVTGVRALAGWDPVWNVEVLIVAWSAIPPLGFLLGLGAFDEWLYFVSGRRTRPETHAGHGADSWRDYLRVNTDHKVIGVQYVVTTIVFFLVGGLLAMFVRAELAQPGAQLVDTQTYNSLFSVHATLMIFLFVIPVFAGLGNYVIPLMIGAPDMAFPRLNALSYWLLFLGGAFFLLSFAAPGGAFAAGWTNYPPLAEHQPPGNLFFQMGVQWVGASSIATAINFLATIALMRAPGMTFWRLPLFVWANLTTSMLVVLATPFIAGSQFLLTFDRVLHTSVFEPVGGGYPIGYQHIFWFYSHPAVYIMILPGFGIISEVVSALSRKPIFGYRLMALSLAGILVLSFSVWAHHMFVSGMAPWLRIPMMVASLLIAVPTGIKIFSWLGTLWHGRLHLQAPLLWAIGFISSFVIGGLSGIYLGSVPIDQHASDTYFVVAHLHYVLLGGSVFTIFAGLTYWFPKVTGRMLDERLSRWHFGLTFVGFHLTFFVQHYLGTQGMPRRVADYDPAFANWNLVSSLGSFVLGAAQLIFVYNAIVSWRSGRPAGPNPFRALTLEWLVPSPPPRFNFDRIPRVVGSPYEYGVPGARHAVLDDAELDEPARQAHAPPVAIA